MKAKQSYNLESNPSVVLCDGPCDDGEGNPEYYVCFGDIDGEPIHENKRAIWTLWDYDEAVKFAEGLARKYGLELIQNASLP